MRTLVELYVLRFGIEDLFREIGAGLTKAADHNVWTDRGRRACLDAATAVYQERNRLAQLERVK